MTNRALVTGSEGFTGRYVCNLLRASGWDVWTAGVSPHHAAKQSVQCDLTDAQQVQGLVAKTKPDLVVHLAAIAFVAHGDTQAIYNVNIMGAYNLLAALAVSSHSPSCIVLASSANIYGNQVGGVLTETAVPSPANDYAVSKLAMEHMAALWMDKLPIIITRPFNYTGVGQTENFLIPKIVRHFKDRAVSIELGNIDVSRDISDVRDVARAYAMLAESQPIGEVVNICSGQSYSVKEILAHVGRLTNHELEVRVNPDLVRKNEVTHLQGGRDKLERLLGYWAPISLPSTLEWMVSV